MSSLSSHLPFEICHSHHNLYLINLDLINIFYFSSSSPVDSLFTFFFFFAFREFNIFFVLALFLSVLCSFLFLLLLLQGAIYFGAGISSMSYQSSIPIFLRYSACQVYTWLRCLFFTERYFLITYIIFPTLLVTKPPFHLLYYFLSL